MCNQSASFLSLTEAVEAIEGDLVAWVTFTVV